MKKCMKKRTFVIITVCVLILSAVGAAMLAGGGKKPYKDLDAAQIRAATVLLSPPGRTIQIVEPKELVGYLKDVVIYNKDDSYTEYEGQGVTFTLIMSDGTQTSIMAYYPFLVIDGIGYRAKYEPCEALNSYANGLLNRKDAIIVLDEPPKLDVVSDNTCVGTLLGTYSWEKLNPDGTSTSVESDSAHPLDCRDLLPKFETTEQTATLRFKENPNRILWVQCWSDAHWAEPDAASEDVEIDGYEIPLKPGGYIYEVKAQWDTENGFGGIAYYSFYIDHIR